MENKKIIDELFNRYYKLSQQSKDMINFMNGLKTYLLLNDMDIKKAIKVFSEDISVYEKVEKER